MSTGIKPYSEEYYLALRGYNIRQGVKAAIEADVLEEDPSYEDDGKTLLAMSHDVTRDRLYADFAFIPPTPPREFSAKLMLAGTDSLPPEDEIALAKASLIRAMYPEEAKKLTCFDWIVLLKNGAKLYKMVEQRSLVDMSPVGDLESSETGPIHILARIYCRGLAKAVGFEDYLDRKTVLSKVRMDAALAHIGPLISVVVGPEVYSKTSGLMSHLDQLREIFKSLAFIDLVAVKDGYRLKEAESKLTKYLRLIKPKEVKDGAEFKDEGAYINLKHWLNLVEIAKRKVGRA